MPNTPAATNDPRVMQMTTKDERFYSFEGRFFPSVTWILDSSYPKGIEFYKWLASQGWENAQAVKEAAGDRGSKVHHAIVDLLKGAVVRQDAPYWNDSKKTEEPLSDEEYRYLMTFQTFWEGTKPTLVESETVCFSEKYGYAGTVDAVLKIGKKLYIVDWKTSSRIYPSYLLQVAAYAKAMEEQRRYKRLYSGIVRLGTKHKSGFEFKEFDPKETARHFSLFLAAKQVFDFEHPNAQPDLTPLPESLAITVKR